MKLHVTSFDHL
jgi:hypothetical protein